MTSSPPPTAQVLAEAAASRRASTGAGVSGAQLMQEHEQRQNFRRLIDPGIFRPNAKQVAMESLKASVLVLVRSSASHVLTWGPRAEPHCHYIDLVHDGRQHLARARQSEISDVQA